MISIESQGILLPLPLKVLTKIVTDGEIGKNTILIEDPTKVLGDGLHLKELEIVEMFLSGETFAEISREIGVTPPTIKAILQKPAALEIITKEKDDFVFGLEGLRRKSHEVLGDSMERGEKTSDRLAAVRLLYQRTGELNSGPPETTEDHARNIFIQIQNQNKG